MKTLLFLVFLLASSFGLHFYEPFDETWEERWKIVNNHKYQGRWTVEKPSDLQNFPGSEALTLLDVARHHAIYTQFKSPLNLTSDFVIQYEVKLQNGLECGGAYLKLFSAEHFDPSSFGSGTPFTLMFGPDKCGYDSKIQFIFWHRNPITGRLEEKQMMSPPIVGSIKLTHLYTLVLHKSGQFEIFLDMIPVKEGSLFHDFTPPVNPPKQLQDPLSRKPLDWVDESMIPDPSVGKPEGWDETEPKEVEDMEAIKPVEWLEEEPLFVPDPNAQKPSHWDDQEDDQWTPPQIPNPKCVERNCGKWIRPLKKNEKYKGKWRSPLIDNPDYKGDWSPPMIPNPNYFHDPQPIHLENTVALGFELWTMTDKIIFDNILMCETQSEAFEIGRKIWQPKYEQDTTTYKNYYEDEEEDSLPEPRLGRQVYLEVVAVVGKLPVPVVVGATILAGILPFVGYLWWRRSKDDPLDFDDHLKKRD